MLLSHRIHSSLGCRSALNKGSSALKIGIIGAGFSGVSVAAAIHRLAKKPVEIILFDKSGQFGAGPAYLTTYPFHLLNVRAGEMSVFEFEPDNFVQWLAANQDAHQYLDNAAPLCEQFVPRLLYANYLKELLDNIQADSAQKIKLTKEAVEVIDVIAGDQSATLILDDQRQIEVDKVVLALGNNPPPTPPFLAGAPLMRVINAWDYSAVSNIAKQDDVLIIGTGLSMIDAVQTLHHQQHAGKMYAVSRHGLLPLPHTDNHASFLFMPAELPTELRALTRYVRKKCEAYMREGGDWRAVINALRPQLPAVWAGASLYDKQRFLRHLLPYWNIHRHRVTVNIADLLVELTKKKQLQIISGHVQTIENATVKIRLRHTCEQTAINVKWLINCMGPALYRKNESALLESMHQRGICAFDPLNLGFAVSTAGALLEKSGKQSSTFYTLGPPARGSSWGSSAVPEIRKQSLKLVNGLLRRCCINQSL